MPRFGDLVSKSEGFKGFSNENTTSKDYVLIPINQICCRSVNMYVDKQDAVESLKNSIKKLGLIEPIIVIEIEEYKKKIKGIHEDEIEYLTKMEEKGCKYFISSGHRRFKAYISLALKRDMYPGNQMDHLYSEETKKAIDRYYDERSMGYPDGFKPEYQFYEIPCKIEKKLIENEDSFYNQSNTTQRELTNYEVIINSIYQLNRNGQMRIFEEETKKEVIDNLNSRSLTMWLSDYVKKGDLDKKTVSSLQSDEERRELLMNLPFDKISKTKTVLNQKIIDYIFKDSGRKISTSKIKETTYMLEQLENLSKSVDYDIMSLVYAGEMNFKEAVELSRMSDSFTSDNASKQEKLKEEFEQLLIAPIEEAREKNQKILEDKDQGKEGSDKEDYIKLSEISKECVKKIKSKYSAKRKEKPIRWSNAELIELIYAIDRGDISSSDAIKKIESLNK